MKKFISLMVAVLLCVAMVCPVLAADTFVPSISYKPQPEIVPVKDNEGNDAVAVIRDADGKVLDFVSGPCLEVTSIASVLNNQESVAEDVKASLTAVYNALSSGSITIPYEKHNANLDASEMVIRDLFDARFRCEEHPAILAEPGVTMDIIFDLGVVADAEVFVMSFDDTDSQNVGWEPIVKAVNNGDGTVTCTFEHLCAIEFSVRNSGSTAGGAYTGDSFDMLPWFVVLGVCVVGAAAIVVVLRKKNMAA